MKFPKGWLLELTIIVLADLLIGYLTVESIDSATGARYGLPISRFLVASLGFAPPAAGAVLGVLLLSLSGALLYWLWRYTPGIIVRFVGPKRKAIKGIQGGTGVPHEAGMKVGDIHLAEGGETKQFVDIVHLEGYPMNIYAAVTKEEGREGFTYAVIEPSLSEAEKAHLADLKKLLIDELDVDLRSIENPEMAERYISGKVRELARKYGYKIAAPTMTKLLYYLNRDFIHLGKIEPLMRDKLIEDISCDGAGIPLYIWYRDYESIPTNIVFETDEELDAFVSKLAYSAGKHVSLSEPIVDASLADGSRLHLTYGKEITQKGSTFTIRKFRVDPLTVVDLIKYNTLSSDVAAYLWYLIEKKLALLVAGGTASGKTTSLNALSMFIEPGEKIVSVEDSVIADSEILVSENGDVRKVKIGDYVDAALSRGWVNSDRGHELASPENLKVLTADATGKTIWSQCTALIRHRVKKPFVKVTTRSGKIIEVTGDHSLFSLDDDGRVTQVRASQLRRGSYLAAPRRLPLANASHEFKLDSFPEFAEFGFKPSVGKNGTVSLEQMRVYAKHSPLSIPATITLNEDLAFLAGLWIADGFYGERTVGFSAGEKGIETKLRGIASSLGVNLTRHSDGVSPLINSKPLRVFFESTLKLTGDDYSRHVPDVFFGATEQVVASFLRGYFTGDGSVSASEVQVESASRQLLTDIQTLLLHFGINFSVGTKRKVGSLGGEGTFRGTIVGTAQVMIFSRKIGFEQEGRTAKIFPRPQASKYHLDPIPLNEVLSQEIRAAIGGITQSALGQRLRKGIRRRVISRQTLLELGSRKPEYKLTRGHALAESDYYFDLVAKVENSVREEDVYDLSVPATGRFIANNIICHNTPELNLPHENWIQSVTRGVGTTNEITMFDLLKASLRQRPDVLIVGEVRGEEAFTLLQSIATGHGGLGTIHADSVEAVINRLTTEPMNIPRSLVGTTLDCVVMQLKLRLGGKSVRRVVAVTEVVGFDSRTNDIILNDAFKWDPVTDKFSFTGRSKLFDKITYKFGTRPEEIRRDIDGRKTFLDWLAAKNIRSHSEVSEKVREFYAGPYAVINKAKAELEGIKA